MKKDMLWTALAALILPILARAIWFYPGMPTRPAIATPEYRSMVIPQPPLKTPAAEEKIIARGGIVLVDYVHSNQYQAGEIQSLREAVELRGGRLETLTDSTLLENKLKYANAFLVVSPNLAFTQDEIRIVRAFVNRGGRLVVFTDATRGTLFYDFFTGNPIVSPDVNAVNPLVAPFGISINNDYLYNLNENEGNFRNVFFEDFGKNELTFGLKKVTFYGAHSVKSDSGLVLLRSAESTLSSITDAHSPNEGGAALNEAENVVVFGDFTFLAPPYNRVADNAALIGNIADFMLGGTRKPSLADFPYVFKRPIVYILPTSEVQLTAEIMSALASLQAALRVLNVDMQFVTDAPIEGDLLVLGTFTPSDDLTAFVEPFDLYLDDFNEYVEVPNIGKIARSGNGILLFEPGRRGNTLILLADTNYDLSTFITTLSGGSLSGCVLQETIGVCSSGYGGEYLDEEAAATGEPTSGESTETPAEEPTPTPTPVPPG